MARAVCFALVVATFSTLRGVQGVFHRDQMRVSNVVGFLIEPHGSGAVAELLMGACRAELRAGTRPARVVASRPIYSPSLTITLPVNASGNMRIALACDSSRVTPSRGFSLRSSDRLRTFRLHGPVDTATAYARIMLPPASLITTMTTNPPRLLPAGEQILMLTPPPPIRGASTMRKAGLAGALFFASIHTALLLSLRSISLVRSV